MKNLCSLPWTGFSNEPNGKAQPCCLYKGYITKDGNPMYVQNSPAIDILKSEYMIELRNKFRRNEKPIECAVCWTDEANGYESKRQVYRNKIHNQFDINFEKEPEQIQELQLIINNSCNYKCRSCTPSHSSQWQQEIKMITGQTGYDMPFRQSADELGKLWLDRANWYKGLRRLEVVGGEPFYVKQWHIIFNELIEQGLSKQIDITMTTNCSLFYPKLIELMAENFKSVSIGLSIDGIGSVYEYLRHPGKWDVVLNNIQNYYLFVDRINLQINVTIGWLNALDLPKLHSLIYSEFPKFNIWNNLIHNPTHMTLWAAPVRLKKQIERKWKKFNWDQKYIETIESLINYMNSKDITIEEHLKNLEVLNKTDKFRKENLEIAIPDISKLLI